MVYDIEFPPRCLRVGYLVGFRVVFSEDLAILDDVALAVVVGPNYGGDAKLAHWFKDRASIQQMNTVSSWYSKCVSSKQLQIFWALTLKLGIVKIYFWPYPNRNGISPLACPYGAALLGPYQGFLCL